MPALKAFRDRFDHRVCTPSFRRESPRCGDNIRTSLYGAEYDVRLVSRATGAAPTIARIVGKHCESGDIVVRDTWVPDDITPGDLVAVAATGAYCYSLSSRYNLIGRPAVVAVRDGRARLILRRETVDDLLSLEVR